MKIYESDSSSDSNNYIKHLEMVYKEEYYIFDNGKLYNKIKIGLKGN